MNTPCYGSVFKKNPKACAQCNRYNRSPCSYYVNLAVERAAKNTAKKVVLKKNSNTRYIFDGVEIPVARNLVPVSGARTTSILPASDPNSIESQLRQLRKITNGRDKEFNQLKEKIKTLENKNVELKVLYEVEKSKRDALLREIRIKTEEFIGLEVEVADLTEKVGTLEKQLAAAMMEEDSDEDSE
jgi:septal ring factor EnvC (AmiA/AmiB activator)